MSKPKRRTPSLPSHVQALRDKIKAMAKNMPKIESPSFGKLAVRQMETMNLTLECAASCAEEGDFATTAALLTLAAGDARFVAAHKRDIKMKRVNVKGKP